LIACGQDLVTQFQNATDEGLWLVFTLFFSFTRCRAARFPCNSLAA
jgi:hypothetical protein